MVKKVISGGQTGVDLAALDAAMETTLSVGGACPKGRRYEAGRIPEHYPLQELTSSDYLSRTVRNVLDADGTLVLAFGEPTGGTLATIECANNHRKPLAVIDLLTNPKVDDAQRWIENHGIRTLNVAGPRGSHDARVYPYAHEFLRHLFGQISS